MTPAVTLPLLFVLAGGPFITLDDALEAARKGQELEGNVSASIGKSAIHAVGEASDGDLRLLFRIARFGGQEKAMAVALANRISRDPEAAGASIDLLASTGPELTAYAASKQFDLPDVVAGLLRGAETPRRETIVLLARLARPVVLLDFFVRWARADPPQAEPIRTTLEALQPLARGGELFPTLLTSAMAPSLESSFRLALRALAAAHPEVHEQILDGAVDLDRPVLDRARLIACLPAVADQVRARAVALDVVVQTRGGPVLAAGLRLLHAYKLHEPAALRRALDAAGFGDVEVQAAGLKAVADVAHEAMPDGSVLRQDARRVALAQLDRAEEPEILLAAIKCVRSVAFDALEPRLWNLIEDETLDLEVRQVAVKSLSFLTRQSADRLLLLMRDPDLGSAAWQKLCDLSHRRYGRHRTDAWRQWREQVEDELPAE